MPNNTYFTRARGDSRLGSRAGHRAGREPGHIYVVELMGPFEDDPTVTNKRFPGNPTQSYQNRHPPPAARRRRAGRLARPPPGC